MYHQTTPLTADQLREAIASCSRQELKVLRLFREHGQLTPSECWQRFGANDALLTSIRRAITDLTECGLLVKLTFVREGFYGKPEHVWAINNQFAGDGNERSTHVPGDRCPAVPLTVPPPALTFPSVSVPTESEHARTSTPGEQDGEACEGAQKLGDSEPHSHGGREQFAGGGVERRNAMCSRHGTGLHDPAGGVPRPAVSAVVLRGKPDCTEPSRSSDRPACKTFTGELFAMPDKLKGAGTY